MDQRLNQGRPPPLRGGMSIEQEVSTQRIFQAPVQAEQYQFILLSSQT